MRTFLYFVSQSTFTMDEMYRERLKDLSEIRSMMENSSKFMSLSGLSGVAAGIVALVGAWVASEFLEGQGVLDNFIILVNDTYYIPEDTLLWKTMGLGVAILLTAVLFATLFSVRMARKKNLPLWNRTAERLLINMMIPLGVGAVFCFQLARFGFVGMVAPATLVFYGLALLNAGKYTLREIRYLGLCEIGLGLIAGFMVGYGLIFWVLGFGVLHIIYGVVMYLKYER
ncbi:MAG: hypothetical protein AAF927_10055 [Bacteroidota bacterium]